MDDDGCDLFVDYADMARNSPTQEPEKHSHLEVVDNIVPTDGVEVVEWICVPINPNLLSGTTVIISKWMYEIDASGVLGDLLYITNTLEKSRIFHGATRARLLSHQACIATSPKPTRTKPMARGWASSLKQPLTSRSQQKKMELS